METTTKILIAACSLVAIWCFVLTYIVGNTETKTSDVTRQVTELENTVEKLQYHIENQRDTIVFSVENHIKIDK